MLHLPEAPLHSNHKNYFPSLTSTHVHALKRLFISIHILYIILNFVSIYVNLFENNFKRKSWNNVEILCIINLNTIIFQSIDSFFFYPFKREHICFWKFTSKTCTSFNRITKIEMNFWDFLIGIFDEKLVCDVFGL